MMYCKRVSGGNPYEDVLLLPVYTVSVWLLPLNRTHVPPEVALVDALV